MCVYSNAEPMRAKSLFVRSGVDLLTDLLIFDVTGRLVVRGMRETGDLRHANGAEDERGRLVGGGGGAAQSTTPSDGWSIARAIIRSSNSSGSDARRITMLEGE